MARIIELYGGYNVIVDDEDYDKIIAAGPWSPHVEKKSGKVYNVYAYRHLFKENGQPTTQKMHRFVLGLTDSKIHVDHIHGNGLDNRKNELRVATHSQNMRSSKLRKNLSGYKGVHWHNKANKWAARITVNNKYMHLGLFSNILDAAKAYDDAAVKYFGDFALTNKVLKEKQAQCL